MNEELISTAESAIGECASHLDKLQDSEQYLQRLRPFTSQTPASLALRLT